MFSESRYLERDFDLKMKPITEESEETFKHDRTISFNNASSPDKSSPEADGSVRRDAMRKGGHKKTNSHSSLSSLKIKPFNLLPNPALNQTLNHLQPI